MNRNINGRSENNNGSTRISIKMTGFGLGALLAAGLSYSVNHSIVWLILHGVCGWFYVAYYAFTKA